jgi:hypothetical protein
MTDLHRAIMNREGISFTEADEIFQEMKSRIDAYEDPEEVLFENGFEPDYMFDLLYFSPKDLLKKLDPE